MGTKLLTKQQTLTTDGPTMELKLLRKSLGIRVRGVECPPPLPAHDSAAALPDGFGIAAIPGKVKNPTVIQLQLWPAILAGLDCVAIAPTGSGKTLGYLLPGFACVQKQKVVKSLPGSPAFPRFLILVPTREIAMQVAEVATRSLRLIKIRMRCLALVGGKGTKAEQVDELLHGAPTQVVVGTCGEFMLGAGR